MPVSCHDLPKLTMPVPFQLILTSTAGIGLMAARALASQGAKVYITGRRTNVLEAAAKTHGSALSEQGGSLVPLQLDVTDKESLRAAAAKIESEEGKLHVLVNNAGVEGPVTKTTEVDWSKEGDEVAKAEHYRDLHWKNETVEDWNSLFTPNVHALFFATMAFLPLLAKGNAAPPTDKAGAIDQLNRWTGSVINITSISGLVKLSQNHFAYNASKAAANSLTYMLSHELKFSQGGPQIGLRVNAIAPGLFASEMTTKKSTLESGGLSSADDVDKGMSNPAGRIGLEEDMAQAILFLSSCQFATGQVIAVDGGFTAVAPSSR